MNLKKERSEREAMESSPNKLSLKELESKTEIDEESRHALMDPIESTVEPGM